MIHLTSPRQDSDFLLDNSEEYTSVLSCISSIFLSIRCTKKTILDHRIDSDSLLFPFMEFKCLLGIENTENTYKNAGEVFCRIVKHKEQISENDLVNIGKKVLKSFAMNTQKNHNFNLQRRMSA